MNIPENHLVSPPNAGIGKYFRLLQSMNVELDNTACWNPWKASSGIQYGQISESIGMLWRITGQSMFGKGASRFYLGDETFLSSPSNQLELRKESLER